MTTLSALHNLARKQPIKDNGQVKKEFLRLQCLDLRVGYKRKYLRSELLEMARATLKGEVTVYLIRHETNQTQYYQRERLQIIFPSDEYQVYWVDPRFEHCFENTIEGAKSHNCDLIILQDQNYNWTLYTPDGESFAFIEWEMNSERTEFTMNHTIEPIIGDQGQYADSLEDHVTQASIEKEAFAA
ncbi:MAG: hypothetical protein GY940_35090 [bacterium]|nr:hypothetical protein [bacterium]